MQQNTPPLHALWTPEILRWRLGSATPGTPCGEQPESPPASATASAVASPIPDALVQCTPSPDMSAPREAALAPPHSAPRTQQGGSQHPTSGPACPAASNVSRDMERVARLAAHGGRRHVLLLGTPSRHEIETLLGALPEHVRLVLCSMSPDMARARLGTYSTNPEGYRTTEAGSERARNISPDGPMGCLPTDSPAVATPSPHDDAPTSPKQQDAKPPFLLLCDTSPWALLLLLHDAGVAPETTLVTFCADQGDDERPLLRQLRKLFLMATRLSPPSPPDPAPVLPTRKTPPSGVSPLHVCAILHPHEPGLDTFFAQIPSWLSGVTAVWDGDIPSRTPGCAVPVRHVCRPLDADFAAQRNAMLDATPHEWVVYLDADEILSPGTWSCIRTWTSHAASSGIGGIALPRHTFLPDGHDIRVGFGLWPDIQLRLFRNAPGVRFEGRIHERVTGLHGGFILLPGHPILHHSLTGKDRQAIEARLRTFDIAAGRSLHRLSHEYPGLPRQAFEAAARHWGDAALYFRDA